MNFEFYKNHEEFDQSSVNPLVEKRFLFNHQQCQNKPRLRRFPLDCKLIIECWHNPNKEILT